MSESIGQLVVRFNHLYDVDENDQQIIPSRPYKREIGIIIGVSDINEEYPIVFWQDTATYETTWLGNLTFLD